MKYSRDLGVSKLHSELVVFEDVQAICEETSEEHFVEAKPPRGDQGEKEETQWVSDEEAHELRSEEGEDPDVRVFFVLEVLLNILVQ